MNLMLVLDTNQPFDKYLIERQIMRKKSLLWAALSIAALTANCQPAAQSTQSGATTDSTNAPSPSVKQQWQNVKSDITNTWQDVKRRQDEHNASVGEREKFDAIGDGLLLRQKK